ncbi:hypothetical protein BDZ89DRAFT_1132757 [Hymenopellis radicata]|nr:hypothetical protein BDZ89DRAFT_1132757 [Hymenopellis radicata]
MTGAEFWDAAATSFLRFPHFNPMMMINTSETCASRRLLECCQMGMSMNDVSRKFSHDWSSESLRELSQEERKARKSIIEFLEAWCEKNKAESEVRRYPDE